MTLTVFKVTAVAIGVNLLSSSNASAFTPSFSMIKEACSQMQDGIQRQLLGIEGKINIAEDQEKAWRQFTTRIETATKPIKQICTDKFGPGATDPGWFGPTAQRKKADADKQQFMTSMQSMGKEMETATEALKASLRPEQLSIIEREFAKR
jgi:LTXXQ motif family protein